MTAGVVLIVEDDPDILELLARRVRRTGREVVTATSGEEGLRLAAELTPDLAIVDIRLPGISGWEVIERMSNDDRLCDVPVVIASITDPGDARSTNRVHLIKPIGRGKLEAALREALDP